MKDLFIQILISFKYQQHSQKWVLGATPFPVCALLLLHSENPKHLASVFPHRFCSESSVTNFAANSNNLRNWNKTAVNEF